MTLDIWFWIWAVMAAVLLVAEIFTAGFFMLPFSLGAATAAVFSLLGLGLGWQWLAFILVSAVALVSLRRLSDRVTHEPPEKFAADRLVGKPGVVIETLEPDSPVGMVRIGREEWRADDVESRPLPEGTRVKVVRVEGTHLVVEPAGGTEEVVDPVEGGG